MPWGGSPGAGCRCGRTTRCPSCPGTPRSNAEATPQLAGQVRGLLAAVAALSSARRSPVDLLLFLEVSLVCDG